MSRLGLVSSEWVLRDCCGDRGGCCWGIGSPSELLCCVVKHRNNGGCVADSTKGSGRSSAVAFGESVGAGSAARQEPREMSQHCRTWGPLRGQAGAVPSPDCGAALSSERRGA